MHIPTRQHSRKSRSLISSSSQRHSAVFCLCYSGASPHNRSPAKNFNETVTRPNTMCKLPTNRAWFHIFPFVTILEPFHSCFSVSVSAKLSTFTHIGPAHFLSGNGAQAAVNAREGFSKYLKTLVWKLAYAIEQVHRTGKSKDVSVPWKNDSSIQVSEDKFFHPMQCGPPVALLAQFARNAIRKLPGCVDGSDHTISASPP